jgi:sugar O-acyltransferase (sialic acid O-acetyltransferase NeuD family)
MSTLAPRQILIFPCNGNGLEALDCLGADDRLLGFIDDVAEKQGQPCFGNPVWGRDALTRWPSAQVLAVPGGPTSYLSRRGVIDGLNVSAERFATVVHPSARVSPLAKLGHNVLVMAGVVITSNAKIGNHVCILPNTVIHHDAVIGSWTLIGSNVTIAGQVSIGENCYVGSGTSIMHALRIEDGALIGLGSNVIRNVPARETVAGNPARVLRKI